MNTTSITVEKTVKMLGNTKSVSLTQELKTLGIEVGDTVRITIEKVVAPFIVYAINEEGEQVTSEEQDIESARFTAYYALCHNGWKGVKVIDNTAKEPVSEFWHTFDGREAFVTRNGHKYRFTSSGELEEE